MTNNSKIILIVLLVLLLGGGYFVYANVLSKSSGSDSANVESTGTVEKSERSDTGDNSEFKGDVFGLLALGTSQKCEMKSVASAGEFSGDYYISGGRVYANIKTTAADASETEMHTLVDGDNMYTWSYTPSKYGVKMSLAASKEAAEKAKATYGSTADQPTQKYPDLSAQQTFECSPWIPDASKFELPDDIEFTDLSGMMEQFGNYGQ